MDKLKKMKDEYENMEIPEELDFVVKKAIKESRRKMIKPSRKKWLGIAAAAALIFFASINMSPALADALSDTPIVGGLVKVLTIKHYILKEDTYDADIKTPAVAGLENKELQKGLNDKYLEENKKLYEEFVKEVEALKAEGGGHMGIDSGYEVKTDNERILSIGRYVVNTVGSSSTTFEYDTIDKKNQVLITLPSLFKDESYIDLISQNIKDQMIKQMKDDPDKTYWVNDETMGDFDKINKEQDFYINNNGKLIISFDKYEVAPGYMGVVEFEIPTDAISGVLVSSEYIK